MDKLTPEAKEAVKYVTDAVDFQSVFYNDNGSAIIDGDSWLVYVYADGSIYEVNGIDWETGFTC